MDKTKNATKQHKAISGHVVFITCTVLYLAWFYRLSVVSDAKHKNITSITDISGQINEKSKIYRYGKITNITVLQTFIINKLFCYVLQPINLANTQSSVR